LVGLSLAYIQYLESIMVYLRCIYHRAQGIPMNDTITTIETLKNKIKQFVEERNWQQYHSPKNLSMNIAVEAAELMEIFNWTDTEESKQELEKKRQQAENEIADIAFSLLNLCMRYNVDLTQALERKIALNAQKYPIEKSKGKITKYTEL
jgi:dCTP diphosphatase